ncbi:PAS domain-containing protein [Kordiimonas aestuarii]|uniref:PAS domain-containing protein n=1 Tax=Kordiimonas aestuarii TaxID=1005925 RepID=UPI0021CF7C05|nr:PAS domain-containing protein [Kordiimonas aestuarii]
MLDCWHGLIKDGLPPEKRDLNIRVMARFLPHVALIDCDTDDEARVHLAGAEVERIFGRRIAGSPVGNFSNFSGSLHEALRQSLYRHDSVRYHVRKLDRAGRPSVTIGVLELPVRGNHCADDRLVLVHVEVLH